MPSSLVERDDSLIRHPIFWFDDGSVVVRIQDRLFKLHRSLLSRHSNFFAQYPAINRVPKEAIREDWKADDDYIDVDRDRHVLAEDVEVLLEHLYHDV